MMRVGYLSAVRHAASYHAVLASRPDIEFIGVAEDSGTDWIRADSERFAREAGIPFSTDPGSLLDGSCDLVIVCSEPVRHAELAIRALEAGCHVIVDKPVATSVADVDLIIAAEKRSRATATVINRLRSPAIERMRGWIDAGHLGLPLHVDVEWFASGAHFATSVERPELVNDPALSGGGELLNFLLYPVDYIRSLTGLDVRSAYAETATLFQATHAERGVEDSAVVSLGLARGVTATITLARLAAAPGHGPVSTSVRVIGSRGFATSDDDQPAVSVYDATGRETQRPIWGASSETAVARFLDDAVRRLQSGAAPAYSLSDARFALAVTEACYRSSALGQPVAVGDGRE